MVRKSGSQLRDSLFIVAESVLSEQIGRALRHELGTSRHATKEVMRWTCVSDKTARAWINGRAAPSGAHLLALAANSYPVMIVVLHMTGHGELERVIHRLTVKEAIDSCFEARKAQLKGDGAAGRWMSPLKVHVIPKIGKTAVEDVDQHALRDLLAPIWHSKPEAATKALNRLNLTLVLVRFAARLQISSSISSLVASRTSLVRASVSIRKRSAREAVVSSEQSHW